MNELNELNHGTQRIDSIMQYWGLDNHDLVSVSTEQLTHKQVQKARQGRELTLKMMQKVARALNVAIWYTWMMKPRKPTTSTSTATSSPTPRALTRAGRTRTRSKVRSTKWEVRSN